VVDQQAQSTLKALSKAGDGRLAAATIASKLMKAALSNAFATVFSR